MKNILNIAFLSIIALSFSQCSSVPKLEENVPFNIVEVYYQKWVAGTKEGGSGTDLYIKLEERKDDLVLDSVYFRNRVAKLETTSEKNMFKGRFTLINKKPDVILSNEPNAEFRNEVPVIPKKIPFELTGNECVISYKEKNTKRYYKISGIKEKPLLSYPNSPPNK